MSYDISHYRAYAIPVKQFFANSGNADITGSPIWLNINEFIHATGLSVPEGIDLEHPERSSWCSMGPGGGGNSDMTIMIMKAFLNSFGWTPGISEDHDNYHELLPEQCGVFESIDPFFGCISTSTETGYCLSGDATAKENNCYFGFEGYLHSAFDFYFRAALQKHFGNFQTFNIIYEEEPPKRLDVDIKRTIDNMMVLDRDHCEDGSMVKKLIDAEYGEETEYSNKLEEKELWYESNLFEVLTSNYGELEEDGGMHPDECYVTIGFTSLEPGEAWDDPMDDEDQKKTIDAILDVRGIKIDDFEIIQPAFGG